MTNPADIQTFIDRHRILLGKEREAEVKRSSLLLSNCGPKLLEQKGLALGGLGIASINIGLGGKTLVALERPTAYHSTPVFPSHTFRAGDIARIEAHTSSNATKKSKSDESKGSETEGVVYKVSDTLIVLALDASESDDLDLPDRCRVVKLANSVTYDRMDNAIDQLEKIVLSSNGQSVGGRTVLIEVLLGMKPLSPPNYRVADLIFFDNTLNDSQKAAVRFCLDSPEVACIYGPPGTGKTHTLVEIIRQLTTKTDANPDPKRLLVCGASNLSVDNILERLLLALPAVDKTDRLKVTRIGHPARVMSQESILESTLEVKATRTDEAALAREVKEEIETTLGLLSGKGKGAKGKRPREAERKKLWGEIKDLRKEYRQREGGVVKSVLRDSQVVLATCHSSGAHQMANQKFDVVIIDEATQAIEAVCWVPILKAKKLILAGDPMQLPPTILSIDEKKKASPTKNVSTASASKPTKATSKLDKPSTSSPSTSLSPPDSETDSLEDIPISLKKAGASYIVAPKTLETTLFDRLEDMYGSSVRRMLTVQYRMHESICTFPSTTLYDSKLTSDPSVASHLLYDLPNAQAKSEDDEELLRTPVVFFDTAGCEYFEKLDGDADEGSRCNENEATIVVNWVDKLLGVGILPEQIAILTPYQAQVSLLNTLLRSKHGQTLEIGTVDGMQGREKEAVIISLVRSNDTREVGFLKDKRRMNVAMTRARRHLCVVGDSYTVSNGGSYLKKWLMWLESHADVKYAGLE